MARFVEMLSFKDFLEDEMRSEWQRSVKLQDLVTKRHTSDLVEFSAFETDLRDIVYPALLENSPEFTIHYLKNEEPDGSEEVVPIKSEMKSYNIFRLIYPRIILKQSETWP